VGKLLFRELILPQSLEGIVFERPHLAFAAAGRTTFFREDNSKFAVGAKFNLLVIIIVVAD